MSCCVLLHCIVLCCTVLHCVVLCCIVLCYVLLCITVLYYIVLCVVLCSRKTKQTCKSELFFLTMRTTTMIDISSLLYINDDIPVDHIPGILYGMSSIK